jgi:peptidoglycan/xylan/chitin deacetylase (PgdA/CDA1 family)
MNTPGANLEGHESGSPPGDVSKPATHGSFIIGPDDRIKRENQAQKPKPTFISYTQPAKLPRQMTWKRALLKVCSSVMPDVYRPPAGVLFPYAHIVSNTTPVHVRHLFAVPGVAKFKSDLDSLLRRYRPLQLPELQRIPRLHDYKRTPGHFVLSFDDGMREVYDVIAPILREKGIPAIFFLNSATIDNKRLMWRHKVSLLIERSQQQPGRIPPQFALGRGETVAANLRRLRFADEPLLDEFAKFFELDFDEYLRRAKPYMTTDQIRALAHAGFEFGAHGHSHLHFNEASVEDQKQEVYRSVDFLRQLGLQCRCFAFPFDDNGVPASAFSYMTDLNLVLSFGTSEGRVDSIGFSFQRFALDAENASSNFQHLLKQLSVRSVAYRLRGTEIIHRN